MRSVTEAPRSGTTHDRSTLVASSRTRNSNTWRRAQPNRCVDSPLSRGGRDDALGRLHSATRMPQPPRNPLIRVRSQPPRADFWLGTDERNDHTRCSAPVVLSQIRRARNRCTFGVRMIDGHDLVACLADRAQGANERVLFRHVARARASRLVREGVNRARLERNSTQKPARLIRIVRAAVIQKRGVDRWREDEDFADVIHSGNSGVER